MEATIRRQIFFILLAIIVALNQIIVVGTSHAEQQQLRIINGQPASQVWPWMASLSSAHRSPSEGHFCGAVLVAPKYLLTAAHCVADVAEMGIQLQATIGRMNLETSEGTVARVSGIIIHPHFDPFSLANDMAIVRLDTPISADPILPISAAEEQRYLPAHSARILGWGIINSFLHIRTSVLQEAVIPTVDMQACSDALGPEFLPSSMLCAGRRSSDPYNIDGVDTCSGDSGGPLIVETDSGWKIAGLTSWGRECASDTAWGVYSRVAPNADWINTARTVPPLPKAAPRIRGIPIVGRTLFCNGERFVGDPIQRSSVRFRDTKSGKLVSRSRRYRVRKSDAGRRLRCTVSAFNEGGRSSVSSKAVLVVRARR